MKIVVSEITRPSLAIQEIEQSDGSKVLGTQYWSAVDFATDADKDKIVGKHNNIQLQYSNEVWEFTKATVMLHPKPQDNHGRYIITYDRCRYIIGDFIHHYLESCCVFDGVKRI